MLHINPALTLTLLLVAGSLTITGCNAEPLQQPPPPPQPQQPTRRASLTFDGEPWAREFGTQVNASWFGVLQHQFEPVARFEPSINQTLPAGYVSTSIPGKPWAFSLWPRDTSGFLREAIAWGDLDTAKMVAEAVISLASGSLAAGGGGGGMPEHFDGRLPSDSGTAEDGTGNMAISLVMLWQRLVSAQGPVDPLARQIETFLVDGPNSTAKHWRSFLHAEKVVMPTVALPNPESTPKSKAMAMPTSTTPLPIPIPIPMPHSPFAGLVPGTGEFGSGCGLAAPVYNYVQNSGIASALRALAVLERSRGNTTAALAFEADAGLLRQNMLRILRNRTDGGWYWAVNTSTLTPTPDITTAPVNIGFAGINWGFTLLADIWSCG